MKINYSIREKPKYNFQVGDIVTVSDTLFLAENCIYRKCIDVANYRTWEQIVNEFKYTFGKIFTITEVDQKFDPYGIEFSKEQDFVRVHGGGYYHKSVLIKISK